MKQRVLLTEDGHIAHFIDIHNMMDFIANVAPSFVTDHCVCRNLYVLRTSTKLYQYFVLATVI